jgi:hypothetical protein
MNWCNSVGKVDGLDGRSSIPDSGNTPDVTTGSGIACPMVPEIFCGVNLQEHMVPKHFKVKLM